MAATVRLIATDLDGTLISNASERPLYGDFAARIGELRAANQAVWVVLSGRPLGSFLEHFHPMLSLGIVPDFVILKHTSIYRQEGQSFRLCVGWSLHTVWQRLLRPMLTRRIIREWCASELSQRRGAQMLVTAPQRVQLRFKDEESAAAAVSGLRARLAGLDHVKTEIEGAVVDVGAFLHLKGLALRELERQLGIDPHNALAIGNGHHDLSMMEESTACLTGCPANSHTRIIEQVHKAGGHIARKRSLAGVLEIIEAYMNNAVDSSLPPSWRPPSGLRQPFTPPSSHGKRQRKTALRFAAFAVAAYAILMAFASFDLIPYSGLIMKPYELLVTLLSRFFHS